MLPCVVADHANLAADDGTRRIQRQLGRLDEFEFRRVVAIDAEVMDGIAIHRIQLHLLAIEEDRLRGHRPRRDDVPVRQDEPTLGIDDETRGLRRRVPLGVERTRAVDLNGDHPGGDSLQSLGPIGGRTGNPRRWHGGLRQWDGSGGWSGSGSDCAGDGQHTKRQK